MICFGYDLICKFIAFKDLQWLHLVGRNCSMNHLQTSEKSYSVFNFGIESLATGNGFRYTITLHVVSYN